MQTTLTSKGQMTLPQAVRQQLGLRMGDRLSVDVVGGDTIVIKRQQAAPVARLRGLLAKPPQALTVEEMDAGVARHLKLKHHVGS